MMGMRIIKGLWKYMMLSVIIKKYVNLTEETESPPIVK